MMFSSTEHPLFKALVYVHGPTVPELKVTQLILLASVTKSPELEILEPEHP